MVEEPAEAGQQEIFSSWALFILIMLLILALFTSYILQSKKIQAVHETVISIIAGTQPELQISMIGTSLRSYRNAGWTRHTRLPRKCYPR